MILVQPNIFDYAESERHAAEGIALAAENNPALLHKAREIAKEIAHERGEVTADDVQLRLAALGYSVKALGNAAGSLFRGREWEWTGRWVKSARIHAHCNPLRVWRLKR